MRPTTCKVCGEQFHIKEQEKNNWSILNFICPHCKSEYSILPSTERKLRSLQDLFFIENRNEKIMNEMIHILNDYCKSIILQKFSNKINYEGQLDYYAKSAVSFFVEEYYKDKEFKVDVSFAGFLIFKIKQAIFGKQEYASAEASLDFEFADGNTPIYEDKKYDVLHEVEVSENKFLLCKQLLNLIFSIEDYCESKQENYIRLLNVFNYFKYGEKYIDTFFTIHERTGKLITMKTLDILKSELENMLETSSRY